MACAVAGGMLAGLSTSALAASFETLYRFRGDPHDGAGPDCTLVISDDGRTLYGTTYYGGDTFNGTVFALTRANGEWTQEILHKFTNNGNAYAGLLLWRGKLYGTTQSDSFFANGTAFSVDPMTKEYRELYNFDTDPNHSGAIPQAGLHAWNGRLYGSTGQDGKGGGGTIFELSKPAVASDPWTLRVIHNFTGNNGFNAAPGFTMTRRGDIFGNTYSGGRDGRGVVYSVTPRDADGDDWSSSLLWTFSADGTGNRPYGKLLLDGTSRLYGTTTAGGTDDAGTIFRLVRSGDKWRRETLLSFGDIMDGPRLNFGSSDLVMDSNGTFYGTSNAGGYFNGGTLYTLRPPAVKGSSWTLTVLHHFRDKDGRAPQAPPLVYEADGKITLYGTTQRGGFNDRGTVYRYVP